MNKIFLFFFFLTSVLTAQEEVKVDVSTPNGTVYTHLYFLQKETYNPKKSAKSIFGLTEKDAIDKAKKIKKILDGKGLFVNFSQIPNNPNYNDTINYVKVHKYILFPERMPLISVEKIGDNWYYSKETIRNIDSLYESIFPWYVQRIQKIIPNVGHKKILGNEIWQYLMLIILLLISIITYYVIRAISLFVLQKIQYRFTKSNSLEIRSVLKKLAHPISLLVALKVIEIIFPSFQFSLNVNKWVFLFINITAIVFWIYIFLKLVQVVMRVYAEIAERTHGKLDDQLVPILHNFLIGIVVFGGILKLLTLFGVDATTVIAGASIGGLAVALASQDTVKNLIGTLMIFLDKPFHIGDWIEADSISGAVEEVGFRSSRIRGADTTVSQIPNSKLSEIVIKNWGIRTFRRYNTQLSLRYDTPPDLIEAFTLGIKKLIEAHPNTRKDPDSYTIEFTSFGDSGLLVLINLFFTSDTWANEQHARHQLNIAILKLAKAIGVDFAFPSTTMMIEQFPEKKAIVNPYDFEIKNLDETIQEITNSLNKN